MARHYKGRTREELSSEEILSLKENGSIHVRFSIEELKKTMKQHLDSLMQDYFKYYASKKEVVQKKDVLVDNFINSLTWEECEDGERWRWVWNREIDEMIFFQEKEKNKGKKKR